MKNIRQVVTIAVLLLSLNRPAISDDAIRWQDRVIPLPREMTVDGHVTARAGDLAYVIRTRDDAPPFETVRCLFDAFAHGELETAETVIELVLADETPEAVPAELRERLATVANAGQAYVIFPRETAPRGLTIAANTPVGLLYGAHTLAHLINPGGAAVDADATLMAPRARITDWPDIEWRGTWNSAGYLPMGESSRWKFNMQNLKMDAWRGERPPRRNLEIRWMGDIDTDIVRAYMRWAQELGYSFMPSIRHLGTTGQHGWSGISPAVYTEENPAPQKSYGRGFCWAPGQEIYTVLTEEMIRAAALAMEFPEGNRYIEVQLTESRGSHCHCPDCGGESGYVMESRAIIDIFDSIRDRYPVRMVILLTQGSRPVNDRILSLVEGRGDIGVAYYDIASTYRMSREPIIPEYLEAYAKAGGFVQVVLTLTPGRWDVEHPASLPRYIQALAREFSDKKMRSATHYDWQGHAFYYPLNMAAWGEYLWNPRGRSAPDFARAYATLTGLDDPDLFARWLDKADEAAMELAVTQHISALGRGELADLPELRGDDEPQAVGTLRPNRALRAATDAMDLARAMGHEEFLRESEFTLAALRSIVLRNQLREALTAGERDEAARLLDRLDTCARLVLIHGYDWQRHAMEKRDALKEAPGFRRPPVWTDRLTGPVGNDVHRIQYGSWHNLLRVTDVERMTALIQGVPDTRADMADLEIAYWEPDMFENRSATLSVDATDSIRPEGGHYVVGFQTLAGDGSTISLSMADHDSETGEKREAMPRRSTTGGARGIVIDSLLVIPERRPGEKQMMEITLRSHGARGSEGVITLRRVWSRDEFPPEAIDALMEE